MRQLNRIAMPTLLVVWLAVPGSAQAAGVAQFNAVERLRIGTGEIVDGDVYTFAGEVRVSGTVDGDFVAWAASVDIDGEVTGDVIVAAGQLNFNGRAGDSMRVAGSTVFIDGRVEGDLIVFATVLKVREDAHVTGKLVGCAARVTMAGTVEGDAFLTGGEVEIDGTIGGDTRAEADAVALGPGTRIGGDLTYSSRKDMKMEHGASVAGEMIFKERPEKEKKSGWSTFGTVWWIWSTVSAIFTGVVLVALFRRPASRMSGVIGGEPMLGAFVGFGTFLVVPAASMLAVALLISLPLGVLGLALFLIAVYLAKMPVAIWLGSRLLSLLGSSSPSPYLAIVLGLVILQLLFLVPYLGFLMKLAALWLGLGAMILATRSYLQEKPDQPAAS